MYESKSGRRHAGAPAAGKWMHTLPHLPATAKTFLVDAGMCETERCRLPLVVMSYTARR
jgi:hypothetical protein